MKDLRPTYDQNGQKQGKTGKFCKKRYFLGNFYTTQTRIRPQIFGVFALPAQKFPAKITGNFSEHIRELSVNIREFNKLTAKPIFILFFRVYVILFEKKEHQPANTKSTHSAIKKINK